jgi:glycerol kinase
VLEGAVVLAVDQGSSSTKCIAVARNGEILGSAAVPVSQSHSRPGWVEQDADELWTSVLRAIDLVAAQVEAPIAALGIANQRESALVWDRATGEPVGPVLGWQDRRTAHTAQQLLADDRDRIVEQLTGLPIDPMFSALKFQWLLDSVDPDRVRSKAGELAVGTIDAWLIFRLSGEHAIELGNASRTQLVDLEQGQWHDHLLDLFAVPRTALPEIRASDAHSTSRPLPRIGSVPVTAVLADSHAALFAHGVRTPGAVKATYGTGSSIMGLSPADRAAGSGLTRTVAWSTDAVAMAFEGNILSSGATVAWLADLLGRSTDDLAQLAAACPSDHGVDIVPAFSGLGAPWWNGDTRASIMGLTFGSGAAQLARAALESIALQVEDVLIAAEASLDRRIDTVLVDGGPAANDWLCQVQSDLSQRTVLRPAVSECSALGAAQLAGVSAGVWNDDDVRAWPTVITTFEPNMAPAEAARRRARWHEAVEATRSRIPTPKEPA